MAEKLPRTDRSDTEIHTEAEGKTGTSQSQSRHKKGHMRNIYVMDSDHQSFANSHKLSIIVSKTWIKSQRICYGKLTQSKSD